MVDPQYGMTTVDLSMTGYRDDPFVLAKDASQVFYVMDMSTKPKRKLTTENVPADVLTRRHIVLSGKRKIMGIEEVNDEDEYNQLEAIPPFAVQDDTSILLAIENAPYLRCDHNDGRLVKKKFNSMKR